MLSHNDLGLSLLTYIRIKKNIFNKGTETLFENTVTNIAEVIGTSFL